MPALKTVAVILAAGKGTRMNASVPKVLHPILGKPMLEWSLSAGREATGQAPVVVIGPETDEIQERYGHEASFIVQQDRLGTGHALLQAVGKIKGAAEMLLVLNADMPFIRVETLREILDCQAQNDGPLTILTAHDSNSRGFGRVLRDDAGEISAIEEEAHLTPEQIKITELNLGAYCIDDDWVWQRLEKLPQSPRGEYYLTDLVALAAEDGRKVEAVSISERDEIIGINTRVHLAEAEAAARDVVNQAWMLAGVTLVDPNSTYIGLDVEIGRDTIILPNTHLKGKSIIGEDCRLGPNTIIRDSRVGDRCKLEASVIEEAILETDVDAGPFCHLRPGAYLSQGVHMGNFGEVKNSTLGPGVKMGHFSYLGDATVGAGTNIGAGTITANYDGEAKHPTEIGENVFIGSDTMLVAPVRIGDGARTGAGAVVTRDVPANSVAVGVPARVIRRDKEQNDG